MKKTLAIIGIGFLLTLSGCAGFMVLAGPRGMVVAGNGYYKHARQGVDLFKIKAPKGDWYTRSSSWAVNTGEDEPLQFYEAEKSQENGRSYSGISMWAYFASQSFIRGANEKLEFLNGNHSLLIKYYSEPGYGVSGGYRFDRIIEIKGIKCTGGSVYNKNGVDQSARYSYVVQCPGFFRNTLGEISISVIIDDGFEGGLGRHYKLVEPVVQSSLASLKFIEPFSQKISPSFSIDEQLSRIKAGSQSNGYSKFKL